MDIKEYINSGILEQYALNLVNPQEQKEVECLSHIYPEIADELKVIYKSLEKLATEQAVEPNPLIKNKILVAIKKVHQDKVDSSSLASNVIEKPKEENIKMIALNPSKNNFTWMKIAASFLIIASIGSGIYFWQQNNLTKQTLAANEVKLSENQAQILALISANEENKTTLEFISHFATESFVLKGTNKNTNSVANVFWNKKDKKYLFKNENLPMPDSQSQYQLWALVDGKPINLGVLNKNNNTNSIKTIDLEKIDAFAITLEKLGGSETPTLEQLVVIGNTNS